MVVPLGYNLLKISIATSDTEHVETKIQSFVEYNENQSSMLMGKWLDSSPSLIRHQLRLDISLQNTILYSIFSTAITCNKIFILQESFGPMRWVEMFVLNVCSNHLRRFLYNYFLQRINTVPHKHIFLQS